MRHAGGSHTRLLAHASHHTQHFLHVLRPWDHVLLGSKSRCSADDASSSSRQAWPQLYNVTYYLNAANFIGDAAQASTTYTAESHMHLAILQATASVTFHSKDLLYSAVSYTVDQQQSVCVCGPQEGCLDTDCREAVQLKG